MKQNNEALSGLGVGGAHAVCGDSPGGEHHRLPQEQSRSQSGEQLSEERNHLGKAFTEYNWLLNKPLTAATAQ